jgi:NDP-sugar pyrophosphorylase family protein
VTSDVRTISARDGVRLTVEGSQPRPGLAPSASRPGAFDITDLSGAIRGTIERRSGCGSDLEVFLGASGLAVIITHPTLGRYLCFPGSAAALEGCMIDLRAAVGASGSGTSSCALSGGDQVWSGPHRITQAAVMAGGLATRFAPISGPRTGHSKPGVPIAGPASLIRTIVDRLVESGIEDVFINTHYASDSLKAGLVGVQIRLHFLHEHVPSGTAGPIRKALQGVAYPALDLQKPLLLLQGDALTDISFLNLMATHERAERPLATIAVQPVSGDDVENYGIVATDRSGDDGLSGRVTAFMEKPALKDAGSHRLASTGIYVLDHTIYPFLMRAYERELRLNAAPTPNEVALDFARDVFPCALAETGTIGSRGGAALYATLARGYWNDIGSPDRYFQGVRDVRAGLVRLCGGHGALDVDGHGVVYWHGGRACAERASAVLSGNVIVVATETIPTV